MLPFLLLAACATERPVTEPEATSATSVAKAPPAPEKTQFVAVITARHSNVITPDFDGRVLTLKVHGGQRVHKGDVIAELDDTELKEKLAEAQMQELSASAEAGASGATASQSSFEAGNLDKLASQGYAAKNQVRAERARGAEAGARSAASAARAKQSRFLEDDYKTKIAHAKLTAPMDGTIAKVAVKEGELARKGSPVARVFDQTDLLVRFAVPREHRKEVKKGQRVEILLPGLERPLFAVIELVSDELEPPINYTMVDAKIDDSKLGPDEVRVASVGHVRLADAGGKR